MNTFIKTVLFLIICLTTASATYATSGGQLAPAYDYSESVPEYDEAYLSETEKSILEKIDAIIKENQRILERNISDTESVRKIDRASKILLYASSVLLLLNIVILVWQYKKWF